MKKNIKIVVLMVLSLQIPLHAMLLRGLQRAQIQRQAPVRRPIVPSPKAVSISSNFDLPQNVQAKTTDISTVTISDKRKLFQSPGNIQSIVSKSLLDPTSPFAARGGPKRTYTTTIQPVPVSFEPSWMSMIPGTNAHRIETLFKYFYESLEDRRFNRSLDNYRPAHIPYASDVREFESLIKKTGYNPLNRRFEGKASFFAKMLNLFAQKNISQKGSIRDAELPGRFYKLGARWRPEEENKLFFNQQNYIDFFKSLGGQIKEFSFAQNTLKDLLRYIELIREWEVFLNNIDVNITDIIPATATINWDYMKSFAENCIWIKDKNILNMKIENLLEQPYQDVFKPFRMLFGIAIANSLEDLIGIAQKAGFFKSERNYERTDNDSEETPYKGKSIWDLLPGLTSTSSREEIAKIYRTFLQQNHPDKWPKNLRTKKRKTKWKSF